VIDVWGTKADKVPEVPDASDTVEKGGRIPPGSLAKQLALGVKRVVIDPGHGVKILGPRAILKAYTRKKSCFRLPENWPKKFAKN